MASRTAELIAKLTDQVSGPAKKMAGAMEGVSASAKKMGSGSPGLDRLTKQLHDAQVQAEKLAQLQNRMQSLATARTGFNAAKGSVERISRDLDAARKSLAAGEAGAAKTVRDLEREQNRARVAVRSTAQAFEAEATAAKRLRAELASLGVPMTSIAAAQRAVAARAQAATAALEKQAATEARSRRLRDMPGALASRIGADGNRSLGPLAGAVGAFGAASAYKQAAAFDRRLTLIGQTADAGRAEIERMGGSLFELAQETAVPIDKVTGGLENLVAQGRSLKEGLAFLPSVARTAAASGSEVEDIAKTADSVATNFGIAGKQMQKAFDIMVAGGKAGQFELKDMARYLPSLAPAASAVGMKGEKGLSDTVAMLQTIRKGTGTVEEAAASLNNIFQKMESEETTKKFKKMGVDLAAVMKKGRAEGRNLIEVFEEAAQKATKGDLSKLPQLIGDMEFARGVRALLTYRGEWQKLSSTLQQTSAGSVVRDLVQVTKDSQAAVDRLESSWKRLYVSAAKAADAGGISKGLGDTSRELGEIAGLLERINSAYSEGGFFGALKQGFGDGAERLKENRKAWLDHYGSTEDGRVKELEDAKEAHRKKLTGEGRSPAEIADAMRIRDKEIERARRRKGAIDKARAGADLADKVPLRMGVDPTAPIQGEGGGVGHGGKGQAFQDVFPIDTSGRKPLPSRTPLPPHRPPGMVTQSGGADLKDVLGPKLDAAPADASAPAGPVDAVAVPAPPTAPAVAVPAAPAAPASEARPAPPPAPATQPAPAARAPAAGAPVPPAAPAETAVPLPPRRPPELGGTLSADLDEAKKKADALGDMTIAPTIDAGSLTGFEDKLRAIGEKMDEAGSKILAPKVDTSQIESTKPKAEEAHAALDALNATFTPNVSAGSILSALDAARLLNAELSKVEGNAGRARAAVASAGSVNAGGGGRTGAVKSAMSGAFSDQGMG